MYRQRIATSLPIMTGPAAALPYLTSDLAGIGGVLRQHDDDFRVEEIPAYEPDGHGDHVFVRIEKRGLTTPAAAGRMAAALGVAAHDIGWAGMKDRHAVTRQTLSFPPPCTPEAVAQLDLPDIRVLEARRHRHKLRTGHLAGNRFVLILRDVAGDEHGAAERAQAILDRLARPPGMPNWFGSQRFGQDNQNAMIGRAVVTGAPLPPGVRKPRGREIRLYVSALQSELFNEYVRCRMADALFDRVIAGDLMQKVATGGMFASSDPAIDQARLDSGEIVPTGPMYGHKVRLPPAGTPAFEREAAVLASADLTLEAFARVRKLGMGTRRAMAVRVQNPAVRPVGDRALELSFELPAGCYATAVMREIVKGPDSFPG